MTVTEDITRSLLNWRLWYFLGMYDIRQRYRRSILGPFWMTISVGVFILALGSLYSFLFRVNVRDLMPFVAAGYTVWTMMSAVLSESCLLFVSNSNVIKQISTPYFMFVLQLVWKNLLVFLHQLPILVIVLCVFRIWPGWPGLLALPGLFLLVVNALWVSLVLAIFAARFRDVTPIVTTFLQVILFVTPIMWTPSLLPHYQWIVQANIFYHL
ncbi:MAG: ABC transporter permease, partial [Pseudomonadota bacterium]|nr:ABC transporter permease [Pseudomonadota bacterium]